MDTNEKVHKSTYGMIHDADCPGCVARDESWTAGHKNPHRPGTKAHAKWERMNSQVRWATDMRSETYWSS